MANKENIYKSIVLVLSLTAVFFLILLLVQKPGQWTDENSLRRAAAPQIQDQGDEQSLLTSLDFSLKYLEKIDPTLPVRFGRETFTVNQVKDSLQDFAGKLKQYGLTEIFFEYVKENYTFYRSAARNVLFTGYYEARLKGSLTRSERYCCPLYKKPDNLYRIDLSQFPFYEKYKKKMDDLPGILRGRISDDDPKTIVPYYSRDEIDFQQKLAGQDLEIVWMDDAIEVFFLQIQGSGVVELDTGELLRVNYAESNGHPYRAIGRLLLERDSLSSDNLSMQSIRQYLKEHPEEMREIFNYNPSYVFFRVVEQGPLGFLQVPLTPYRSIALDQRLFPRGALCYIDTELPVFDERGKPIGWQEHRGFVLYQDTGGAIRTPARGDLFAGRGEESELIAGHLKRGGMFYFLIKKKNKNLSISR